MPLRVGTATGGPEGSAPELLEELLELLEELLLEEELDELLEEPELELDELLLEDVLLEEVLVLELLDELEELLELPLPPQAARIAASRVTALARITPVSALCLQE